jgi:hypothetical protein
MLPLESDDLVSRTPAEEFYHTIYAKRMRQAASLPHYPYFETPPPIPVWENTQITGLWN